MSISARWLAGLVMMLWGYYRWFYDTHLVSHCRPDPCEKEYNTLMLVWYVLLSSLIWGYACVVNTRDNRLLQPTCGNTWRYTTRNTYYQECVITIFIYSWYYAFLIQPKQNIIKMNTNISLTIYIADVDDVGVTFSEAVCHVYRTHAIDEIFFF